MLFLEYEEYKTKYLETQRKYDDILSEKEELFAKTQPKSVTYDKERVTGGNKENAFDMYLMDKEKKRIDERLLEVKSLLDDREKLLALKLDELYASNEILDKIYRLRKIEKIRVYIIAKKINYSESQVYRILDQIDKAVQKMRENAKISMLE